VHLGRDRTAAAALAALTLALCGCGRDGDRHAVRTVVERFYAAVQDHRGERACALLGADTRKALEQQESQPCAKAIGQLQLKGGTPGAVQVVSTEASMQLVGGDTVFLGDSPQGWRISAAGCRLQDDNPADCELQD
jgi:hypothetical protein